MMMKKNLLMNIPEDVFISNILLSKVMPNKSLLSLRCVCKYLRNLITSPAFIKMHLHHSTNQLNDQLVLVNSYIKIDSSTSYYSLYYSLKFNDGDTGDPCRLEVIMFNYPNDEDPSIWGSCNGLLCVGDCLWNPLTKEYKDLPPPLPLTKIPIGNTTTKDLGSITYWFGYDRFTDDYKIIRCEHIVTKFNNDTFHGHLIPFTEFQVYTLGTNTWRKISSDNNPYKSYFVQPDYVNPMQFVNGAFHMMMSNLIWYKKPSERAEVKIVSFNIEKEVFREMQWPLFKLDNWFTMEIRVLRGCLCVLEFDEMESCRNVWMMMDYGVKESWTKLFTIVQNDVEYFNKYATNYDLLRLCDNGDILIATDHDLLFYDPVNNKSRQVEFRESDIIMRGSEIYIESLVSLNTGVYKGKAEFQDADEESKAH